MPKLATKRAKPQVRDRGPGQHQIVSITPTTAAQKLLHPFSNSRLTNINTCPTYGAVSAQRQYETTARSMALEAGALMHEVFAALRIWQLHRVQQLPQHALSTATRLFGKPKQERSYYDQTFDSNRWRKCWNKADDQKNDRESMMVLAFEMLRSSGWEDSPEDKIRTVGNMEMACIVYIDTILPTLSNFPIYVQDKKNPNSVVGIENTFDVVLTYDDGKQFRFIGTFDGLTYNNAKGFSTLEDNKTASRLDAGWKASFQLSNQVTGYLACAASVYGFDIYNARILGLKIKPTGKGEDVWPLVTNRTGEQLQRWAFWFRHTAEMYEQYKDNYEHAPRYTHSCNRYFRPCSLLSFCCDTQDGRVEQWNEMVPAKSSPSELAAEGD